MHTNNYRNIERSDKVIAKIKWRSFLPPSVCKAQDGSRLSLLSARPLSTSPAAASSHRPLSK